MRLGKKTTSFAEARRVRRGFTLVELIVVLTILAILAAIGVGSAVGYINKSKFDKNSQNAISVYQAAQTALAQKVANGSIDSWIRELEDNEGAKLISKIDTSGLDTIDESVNKTLSLTYNPGSSNKESQELHSFLSGYFYDQSIFSATITIELDISASYTVNGSQFSARVATVFYSLENTASVGWDDKCKSGATPYDGLPNRDVDYRYKTSHVGYFNGSESSVKPQISSVFLPVSQIYDMDGHIVGPTDDPNVNAEGYLFNMRNGETLDVSWAIFDEDGNSRLHDSYNENFTITLYDADEGINANTKIPNGYYVTLNITSGALQSLRYNTMVGETEVIHERIGNNSITRYSRYGTVMLSGTINIPLDEPTDEQTHRTTEFNSYIFPISVTRVVGDWRTGCPKDPHSVDEDTPADYYEYSLSIDGMMTRSDESLDATSRYNIERLFGNTPLNISAYIEGNGVDSDNNPNYVGGTYYSCSKNDDGTFTYTQENRVIPRTYAARAIDDPIYYTDIRKAGNNDTYLTYCYNVNPSTEAYANDDPTDTSGEYEVTGRCVVNTQFGDYKTSYTTNLSGQQPIDVDGTVWRTNGNSEAVIMSFRHLYNIRNITSGTVIYRIVRDLDWYTRESGMVISDVRVYHDRSFHSPVKNGTVVLVSFPAIDNLGSGQTLTSMSEVGRNIYSINNLQMRESSFANSDEGYGLICKNEGSIFNIYTNNFNLVLADVLDGGSDYSSISSTDSVQIKSQGTMIFGGSGSDCVGGLVGINSGSVGVDSENEPNAARNVVSMRNSIVMAGQYWNGADYTVGGVIGVNESSTYGVIEVRGSFAVIGGGEITGGVIGENTATTEARLIINGNKVDGVESEFTLPKVGYVNNNTVSCVIAGAGQVGGAIGVQDGCALNCSVGSQQSTNIQFDSVTGKPQFSTRNDNDYQIDVVLPSRALVLKLGDEGPVGGAIGSWNECAGDYSSIRVNNDGYIIAPQSTGDVNCGGVIGVDNSCTITTVYVDVTNGAGSRIGSMSDTDRNAGAVYSGGAYGRILSATAARNIFVNVDNNGTIVAKGSATAQGAGGAIGGTTDSQARIVIDASNQAGSIIGLGNVQGNMVGTGGAIGEMHGNTKLSAASVVFAENRGTISGVYYVGGSIGNAPENDGKIYADNYGVIKGAAVNNVGGDYVGGAVGRQNNLQNNLVQSILNQGAVVSGINFVGGAAGRIQSLKDDINATVKTIVRGSATVTGTGSLIGGVCGDVDVKGKGLIELQGDSSAPALTVSGGSSSDGVGGVAGLVRSSNINKVQIKTPDQSSENKIIVKVSGRNYIGGAIGSLRSANGSDNTSDLLTKNPLAKDISVVINVSLRPESYIVGSGDYVGGAVGFIETDNYSFVGSISVSSVAGSPGDSGSRITGKSNVGGAVGKFLKTKFKVSSDATISSGITVDFTLAPFAITGTGNNIGGAVGFLDNGKGDGNNQMTFHDYGNASNTFTIRANIGSSSVMSTGGFSVGGAIGRSHVKVGSVYATLSGTVSGKYYVGGAIGCNLSDITNIVHSEVSVGGEVIGTSKNTDREGTDVGGAIGYNRAGISTVEAIISGEIIGGQTGNNVGNYVGGAIGRCYYDGNGREIGTVDATIQGVATVCGLDGVGGAIGFAQENIDSVVSSITGNSYISGRNYIGGAIGYVWAHKGITGDNVRDKLTEGRIGSIRATISADYALRGSTCIGGAVGKSGYKTNSEYRSPALIYVEAEINTAYLFEPTQTGCAATSDACIGGVIGHIVDGRVGSVVLSGTGGTVNTSSGGYPCPVINSSNTVLLAARGRSIGGIIGMIGMDGFAGNPQKVCLSNISVAANGPRLCVVSMNEADRIGGWIGSGYGVHGGIGNTIGNYGNYNFNASVTYNVNNVNMVYSDGSAVGGFCGYINGLSTSNDSFNGNVNKKDNNGNINREVFSGTYALVNVSLNNAIVCGQSEVGGAFGRVEYVNFRAGEIRVNLNNHTYVGDSSTSICYDAGGAIGFLNLANNDRYELNIPVIVNVDATSGIRGAAASVSSSETYGVGGVIGRMNGIIGRRNTNTSNTGVLQFVSSDSTVVSVYSATTNVGGVVGVVSGGSMNNYSGPDADSNYSNAYVEADGTSSCAGGFVGRITAGAVNHSNSSGYVRTHGSSACAGGFVGEITGGTVSSCYSTSLVNSDHGVTGGFVGQMNGSCTIDSSYASGHTYEGQYIVRDGNINGGNGYVGGFAGRLSNNNSKITNCYSTASVMGTATEVGGFVGYAQFGSISDSYCTGQVIGGSSDTAGPGAFAGFVAAGNMSLSSNLCLGPVNEGMDAVGSGSSEGITIVTLPESITGDTPVSTTTPFDSDALNNDNCYLRAVINGIHHGDWPLVNQSGIPIDNADIVIDSGDPDAPTSFSYEYMRQHDFKIDDCITVIIDRGTPNEQILVRDTDYTISYRNNRAVGEATVIIAAKAGSDYQGVISTTFTITPVELSPETVNVQILGSLSYEYTGAPIVPANDIRVTFNGVELVYNVDYYFTYPDRKGKENNNIDIGQITATIHGMGNYCDPDPYENPITVDFEITVIDISDNNPNVQVDMTAAEGLIYTGQPLTPAPIVRYGGRTLTPYDPAHPENDYDYSLDYRNNTEAGTATVTITANPNGNYTGSRSIDFDIAKAPNHWEVEPGIEGWAYRNAPESFEIVGEAQFGNMSYYFYSDYSSAVSGSDENRLTEDQVRNADVGTYYVRFFVDARETDSYYAPVPAVRSFEITPTSIISASVVTTDHTSVDPDTGIPEYQYTGEPIVPALNVTINNQTLVLGTDYQIASYSGDHTNPTATPITVTIEGLGNYTGTNATCQFTIYREYTVTFVSRDVQIEDYAQTIRAGRTATNPGYPPDEWAGHRFNYWYLNDASQEYDFNSVVSGDITLHAKWTVVHTITFITGDESVVVEPITVEHGAVANPPDIPTRDGYVFVDWYDDDACTTVFNFSQSIYFDTPVYAKWNPIVTFNSMGGSDVPSYEVTDGYVIQPSEPEREGYNFNGWYTDEECTEQFDFSSTVSSPIILYAGWT